MIHREFDKREIFRHLEPYEPLDNSFLLLPSGFRIACLPTQFTPFSDRVYFQISLLEGRFPDGDLRRSFCAQQWRGERQVETFAGPKTLPVVAFSILINTRWVESKPPPLHRLKRGTLHELPPNSALRSPAISWKTSLCRRTEVIAHELLYIQQWWEFLKGRRKISKSVLARLEHEIRLPYAGDELDLVCSFPTLELRFREIESQLNPRVRLDTLEDVLKIHDALVFNQLMFDHWLLRYTVSKNVVFSRIKNLICAFGRRSNYRAVFRTVLNECRDPNQDHHRGFKSFYHFLREEQPQLLLSAWRRQMNSVEEIEFEFLDIIQDKL